MANRSDQLSIIGNNKGDHQLDIDDTHETVDCTKSSVAAITLPNVSDYSGPSQQETHALPWTSTINLRTSRSSTIPSEQERDGSRKPVDGTGMNSSGPIQPMTQMSGDDQTCHEFWCKTLAGAPGMLDLPTDRPRLSQGSTVRSHMPILLDESLTKSLKKHALEQCVNLGTVLLSGWSAVLSRLSGQDDITIGFHTVDFGQSMDVKQLDGSILPLRIDLSGEPSVSRLLGRVQEIVSSATTLSLPLNRIVEVVRPSREESILQLFQVEFQWGGQESGQESSSAIYSDLKLHLQELDSEIRGSIQFSSALFDLETIRRHVGYLSTVLNSMVNDVTRPIATCDILPPAEKMTVLKTWNETSEVFSDHLCFHQMFELQAAKTPNSTALVHESEVLSYDELNSRANRLAHHLIGLGVKIETHVAICVDRSPALIVGILAIMKAGGAYVPLDPNYASERVRDILQDAAPVIAIADGSGRAVFGGYVSLSTQVVDPSDVLDQPTSNPSVPGLTSRNLAYIIYTSGSTGKPKGVMIEHRGVVNYAQAHFKISGVQSSSRVIQLASCGFDVSVRDLALSLTSGASLYL
ncbi:hypothetical protein B0O80DRAFT_418363, partial [Mortierella sp. GBAus27b]